MATLAEITLIIACACLVDCRFLQRPHKHLPADHQAVKTNIRDADAVIFPSDNDSHLIKEKSKIVDEVSVKNPNKHGIELKNDKIDVANIVMPLVSKVIPEVEVKDVFTNPVSEKLVTDKNIDDKEPVTLAKEFDTGVNNNIATAEIKNITDNIPVVNNDTVALNETVPDFSSRFGGASNYMLVPVAANGQNYQPTQSNPNLIPISNAQGNIPTQTYLTPELNSNNQQFIPSNVGSNMHYTTPNGITNVGNTFQAHANIASNNGPAQFPANNANYAQGTNIYIPVNVPNTYVINGQLYAAVTVPNNENIPSALYYVNPQLGYQVANNLPLYKLVSVNGENQLQNTKFVQS